jgi:RimJ/RimL family protein N-acetyltransferase
LGVVRDWLLWWWPSDEAADAAVPEPEEVTLPDGTAAWIRPVLPSDRELHRTAYEHLSDRTKYQRFLTPVPHLTDELLDQLVDDVDGVDHVAYYLFLDGQRSALPVAIGRIVRYPNHPDTADIAVTVQDDWQGHGIATTLLRILVDRRPVGVRRILTVVSADNEPSRRMLRRIGLARQETPIGDGVVEFRINLVDDDVDALAELPRPDTPEDWQVHLRARDRVCPWLA